MIWHEVTITLGILGLLGVAVLCWWLAQTDHIDWRRYFSTTKAAAPPLATATVQLGPPQTLKIPPLLLQVQGRKVRQGLPLVIPPKHKPLWFDKGWRKADSKSEYIGNYSINGRTWQGLITEPYPRKYMAYIWNPPLSGLERNTTHRACFAPNGTNGRHQIHFSVEPSSLDHAIASIEVVLGEASHGRAYTTRRFV